MLWIFQALHVYLWLCEKYIQIYNSTQMYISIEHYVNLGHISSKKSLKFTKYAVKKTPYTEPEGLLILWSSYSSKLFLFLQDPPDHLCHFLGLFKELLLIIYTKNDAGDIWKLKQSWIYPPVHSLSWLYFTTSRYFFCRGTILGENSKLVSEQY